MNRSAKGRRIEHKARDLLESLGYVVTRAAASRGPWDLVATHPTHVRYIQVKGGLKPSISRVEMEELAMARLPHNCSREVWLWADRAKYPRVEVL